MTQVHSIYSEPLHIAIEPSPPVQCLALLLGACHSGKSSLVAVLRGGVAAFNKTYTSTLGLAHASLTLAPSPPATVDERLAAYSGAQPRVQLHLLDASGTKPSCELLQVHVKFAHAILIAVDLTCADSWAFAKAKVDEISDDKRVCLILTKTDLEVPGNSTVKAVRAFADSRRHLRLLETSAALGNVRPAFEKICGVLCINIHQ